MANKHIPGKCVVCRIKFIGRGQTCSKHCTGVLSNRHRMSRNVMAGDEWRELEPLNLGEGFWKHNVNPKDGGIIRITRPDTQSYITCTASLAVGPSNA